MKEIEQKNGQSGNENVVRLVIKTHPNLTELIEGLSRESGKDIEEIVNEMLRAGSGAVALNIKSNCPNVVIKFDQNGRFLRAEGKASK